MVEQIPLTEEWLASVGFKYRPPEERQPFKHWKIQINQKNDYGLYIETTKPGWINSLGEHVNADAGWFLWAGREHHFFHIRHVYNQSDIISIVEAFSGWEWNPENHVYGQVWKYHPDLVKLTS